MHFLQSCLQPNAVLMLFVAASCLVGFGYPGYLSRNLAWLLWLFIGILALVSWILIVGGAA